MHLFPLQREIGWSFLYPLSCVWALATHVRRAAAGRQPVFAPRRKTVVVGNLHSGGSGKTPLVAAIAEHFSDRRPVIVSRGYRGSLSQRGAKVDRRAPGGPASVGDEPWMLAQRVACPVYIGADRAAALARAESETEGDLFILDDAFQNLHFRHDIDLVAIQTDRLLDESYCLPLGDLREPFSALHRASAVVLIPGKNAESAADWNEFLQTHFPGVPCFEARLEVEGIFNHEGRATVGTSLHWGAFSGIARPQAFATSLGSVVTPKFVENYPDHHAYDAEDVDHLMALKAQHDTHHFVTTEKDWHKARPLFLERAVELFYLRIGYVLSEDFWYFLKTRLETA